MAQMPALQTRRKWGYTLKQIQMARNPNGFAQSEGKEEVWPLTCTQLASQSGPGLPLDTGLKTDAPVLLLLLFPQHPEAANIGLRMLAG